MTESSAEILESSEFNPRLSEFTIYHPPAQSASESMVGLKLFADSYRKLLIFSRSGPLFRKISAKQIKIFEKKV